MTPRRLFDSLSAGVRGVLPVVAVCAAAGVITAMTTTVGRVRATAAETGASVQNIQQLVGGS